MSEKTTIKFYLTISKKEWESISEDYKGIDKDGIHRKLMLVDGVTCSAPVKVVSEIEKALFDAINKKDLRRIDQIIDFYRFKRKMNYSDIHKLASDLTGISESDWDDLMYQLDALEA
jgi:hypothetical protein